MVPLPRGQLPVWVGWLLIAASLMTVLAAHTGVALIIDYGKWTALQTGTEAGNDFALAVAFVLILCWAPNPSLSRAIRVAILFPFVQVAAAAGVAAIWAFTTKQPPRSGSLTPYLDTLSPALVLAAATVATIVAGAIIGPRRQKVPAIVTLSLVHLLLFGLWMPLATSVYVGTWLDGHAIETNYAHLHVSWPAVALIVGPPLAGACVVTALAFRRHAWFRRAQSGLISVLAVCLLLDVCVRAKVTYAESLMFANFAHIALALAVVATLALVALGISLWLRVRRGRMMLANKPLIGTIVDDGGGPVASLRITGWLRAADIVGRPFELLTDHDRIAVPAGVDVVCQPPHETTQLAAGGSVVLLEPGARIEVAGFVKADEDSPYRGSAGLMPSSSGVWIAPVGAQIRAFETVALTMWRPCIAYLLVVATVMLPALAGVLGT